MANGIQKSLFFKKINELQPFEPTVGVVTPYAGQLKKSISREECPTTLIIYVKGPLNRLAN